ncbi:MAG: YciI family protein [Psychrobacter sp.]|nr:YciI family protein [Psychrobacter sp.]
MPLFAIIGHDVADSSESRKTARSAHSKRLKALAAEGRLVIAGPTPIAHANVQVAESGSPIADIPAMSGSIIIADFASLIAAQNWANSDPYFLQGVYSHVDIKPFVQVLPQVNES